MTAVMTRVWPEGLEGVWPSDAQIQDEAERAAEKERAVKTFQPYMTGREAMHEHALRMQTKPSGVDYERQAQLAKEWGMHVKGWVGASGGWVYTDPSKTTPICQGWRSVWSHWKRDILDWLTASLTAARTLDELCVSGVENHYRPTILPRNWRYVALADAYDERQWERKDSRRAWRGSGK